MTELAAVVPDTTQALIVVKSKPAMLKVNFDELKTHLTTELKKYDLVVTQDTMKGAKELATELNKLAGEIDSRRKEEVASVSEPIKKFDSQMKELVTLTQDGRKKLLDQIKKFEDETRAQCKILLGEYRHEQWVSLNVHQEYRRAEYEDLILISNVTATGNLTQKAKDTLSMRCRDDLSHQDKVSMRLVLLENASLKAGLSTPLTRVHVAHFLDAEDAVYEAKLSQLIEIEVNRQEQAEEAMRAKLEKERKQKEERERQEQERPDRLAAQKAQDAPVVEKTPPAPIPTPTQTVNPAPRAPEAPVSAVKPEDPPAYAVPEGKKLYVVSAMFEVLVPSTVSAAKVEAKLREKLTAAGITSLKSIIVSA